MQEKLAWKNHLWLGLAFTLCFLAGSVAATLLDSSTKELDVHFERIGGEPFVTVTP